MFRNYLTTALRNMAHNKLYAAINIAGLALGFATALLIALFVRDEVTYDTWVPNHANIFRLALGGTMRGSATLYTDGTHASNALMIREAVPEVERVARLWPEQHGVRGSVFENNDTIVWADAEFLEMFPFHALAGDPISALRQADQAVVTRTFALKYFGRDDVVGETLELDRKLSLKISAVIADFPSRSHLNISVLLAGVSSASPIAAPECCWVAIDGGLTYVEVRPGMADAAQRRFPAVIDKYIPGDKYGPNGEFTSASYAYRWSLIPLSDLHLMSWSGRFVPTHHGILKPPGERALVPALIITGALILLIAMVNGVGLISARANRRMIEVGVRKASGAQRVQLIAQFMGEAALYVLSSLLIALAAVKVILPNVNAFLARNIAIELGDPQLVAAIVVLVLLAAVTSGMHPAVTLSGLRPAAALKSNRHAQSGSVLIRHGFVATQFAILIALIVALVSIDRQTRFAMNSGFRFNTDQLLVIEPPCNASFKERIAVVPGVRGVACTGPGFLSGTEAVGQQNLADGRQFPLTFIGVDPALWDLIGIRPIAGRLVGPGDDAARDTGGGGLNVVVLNETAVRGFGFTSAEEAVGKLAGTGGAEIIGVVPDFPLRSLREAPVPTAFIKARNIARTPSIAVVKLAGDQVAEALRGIDEIWESLGTGRPIPRRFYDQHVQAQYIDLVRQSQAFRALSVTAIALAALGLFGLSAFTAEQRTKEIGIRKSMGASKSDILLLLLWQFTKPVLWANIIAWPIAYFLMQRWLEGFAYHIDLAPWMFLVASTLALLIAIATVIGHALLVARAQPVTALRYE